MVPPFGSSFVSASILPPCCSLPSHRLAIGTGCYNIIYVVSTRVNTEYVPKCGEKLASYDPNPFTVLTIFLPNIVHFVFKDQIRGAWKSSIADIEDTVACHTLSLLFFGCFHFLLFIFGWLLAPLGLDPDSLTILATSTNIGLLTLHEHFKRKEVGNDRK
jgi:hypothetical protein